MTVERDFATVEAAVSDSTELWARDLKALFEHAKDRFGDVSWETELGGERIWGHKAVIYARAPKAFKDRYFVSTSFSRSPTLRTPSPSPSLLAPPIIDSRATTPPSSFRHPNEYLTAPSRTSVRSSFSDFTVRAPGENILRLPHGDTPELFQAQLEWLYTGEGFADVVEWISEDDNVRSIRDSLGRHGSLDERRDKLGQDLTYMWRSKLYVDVRIHLTPLLSEEKDSDSDDSIDSLSSTSVFTAHRFVLVSRSPYFSSLLLNHSAFRPASAGGIGDIHLPTPPFTPASLHFCLGWMYAGHLDFSNRSFDLGTAFQIHRAAAYLQLDSLVAEIESRIVWDFCHGLDVAKCRCKKCTNRAARIWRFAISPEVSSVELKERTRRYMSRAWGECWGRDVGSLDDEGRREVVRDVVDKITWRNIAATYRAIINVRTRMENGLRTKGGAATWVDPLADMVERVEERAKKVLVADFDRIADGQELWALLQGTGFSDDVLEDLLQQLVETLGQPLHCQAAPRVYQTLVSSILLKVKPDTHETVLAPRSIGRHRIETAKSGILGHIRRRWLQIRDGGGFSNLENWSIKEIADEIEVDVDELFEMSISPAPPKLKPVVTRAGIPRTVSQSASLHQASTLTLGSGRPSAARARPGIPSDMRNRDASLGEAAAAGLRRLRLSSSASTASRASNRSVTSPGGTGLAGQAVHSRDNLRIRAVSGNPTSIPQGPRARSPTAERAGRRISIGPAARRAEVDRPVSAGPSRSGSTNGKREVGHPSKRDSQVFSGPIRQLMAKGSIGSAGGSDLAEEAAQGDVEEPPAANGSSTIEGVLSKVKGKGRVIETPVATISASTPRTAAPPRVAAPSTRDVEGKGKGAGLPSSSKKAPSIASVRSTRTTKSQTSTIAARRPGADRPDLMPTAAAAPASATVKAGPNGNAGSPPVRVTPRVPTATKAPTETTTPRSRLTSTATIATANSIAPSIRSRLPSAATVKSVASGRTATSPAPPINKPGVRQPTTSARPEPATLKVARTPALSPARSVPDLKKPAPSIASAARLVRPRVSSALPASPSKPRVTPASSNLAVPAGGSAVGSRVRTTSQVTATSMRSTAPSAVTVRGKAVATPKAMPIVSANSASQQKAVEPRSRLTSKASTVSTSSRLPAARSSRPAPPTAMHTLHPPAMRSASASTAEETEARTPRSSEASGGSIMIRKPSEYSDEPGLMSPFSPTVMPPVSMPGSREVSGTRKASAGSTRTQASFWQRQHPASAFDPPKRAEAVVAEELPLPEGVKPFKGPGISLKVGIPCIVNLNMEGRRGRFKAQVKYIGFMADSKGPWIGIETDSLDRLNVPTLPSGTTRGTHYFHLTAPDPASAISEGEQDVQHEQRLQRQRKIEQIRMGLRERKGSKAGHGGMKPKTRNGSLGVGMGYPGQGAGMAGSRATSPFVGHQAGVEWLSRDMRALFVRPSEVVYVVGAE